MHGLLSLAYLVFTATNALADGLEYRLGAGAQNFPLAAAAFGEVGWGIRVWGETQGETQDFRYGYLRPYVRLQSSGLTTKADLALDLYPISLFGLTVGSGASLRFTNPDTLDCTTLECRGGVMRHYAKARLSLGVGSLFLISQGELQWISSLATASRPLGDEMTNLAGAAGGDTLAALGWNGGVRFGEHWLGGAMVDLGWMITAQSRNDREILYAAYKTGPWFILAGAGVYQSVYANRGFTGVLYFQWAGKPSIGL